MIHDRAQVAGARTAPGTRVRTGPADLVIATDFAPHAPAGTAARGLAHDALLPPLVRLLDRPGVAWVGPDHAAGEASASAAVSPDDLADHRLYCEQTIWPVYDDLRHPAEVPQRWQGAYGRVNTAVAEAVADCARRGASVWVHDHQLQLVPARLRALRPDLRIGFLLHTGFPPPEIFLRLRARHDLLDGLLSADVVGFQTASSAENFLRTVSLRRGTTARLPMVGVFPTTVDSTAIAQMAALDDIDARAARIRADLGSPATVVLSLDDGDESSGVDRRLRAISTLLASGRVDPGGIAVVQIVSPRDSAAGAQMLDGVAREVARINGRFASVGRPCVHFTIETPDLAERIALYRAADILMATALREGAMLPALEFVVASRPDSSLVLSEFSGTAEALTGAYLVNPYDEGQLAGGLLAALAATGGQRRERMAPMRRYVQGYDTHAWVRSFLAACAPVAQPSPITGAIAARPRIIAGRRRRRTPRTH